MRRRLVVLVLVAAGFGAAAVVLAAVTDQSSVPTTPTVSQADLAEYQRHIIEAKIPGDIWEAVALCDSLYSQPTDTLIESNLIGEYERRVDEHLIKMTGNVDGWTVGMEKYAGRVADPTAPFVNLSRGIAYKRLRAIVLYACPDFSKFLSAIDPG